MNTDLINPVKIMSYSKKLEWIDSLLWFRADVYLFKLEESIKAYDLNIYWDEQRLLTIKASWDNKM